MTADEVCVTVVAEAALAPTVREGAIATNVATHSGDGVHLASSCLCPGPDGRAWPNFVATSTYVPDPGGTLAVRRENPKCPHAPHCSIAVRGRDNRHGPISTSGKLPATVWIQLGKGRTVDGDCSGRSSGPDDTTPQPQSYGSGSTQPWQIGPSRRPTRFPRGGRSRKPPESERPEMSTMFGAGKLPVLDGNHEFASSAHRAIAEAKEFTWEDYQYGWATERDRLGLSRRLRIGALVRVYSSWASSHAGLSILVDRALPPGLEVLVRGKSFEEGLREEDPCTKRRSVPPSIGTPHQTASRWREPSSPP